MKKRLISILCAAAMATSLFAGATVVSAAENKEFSGDTGITD